MEFYYIDPKTGKKTDKGLWGPDLPPTPEQVEENVRLALEKGIFKTEAEARAAYEPGPDWKATEM